MKYAQGTSVPVDRSVAELRALVQRYGAQGFGYCEEHEPRLRRAMIAFRFDARSVRMLLPLPALDSPEVARTRQGYERTEGQKLEALAAEDRRRWRALVLVVKAKLEAVASGISSLEREFLADLVLPNGNVLHDEIAPRLARWREGGPAVPLIPERASP